MTLLDDGLRACVADDDEVSTMSAGVQKNTDSDDR